MAKKTEDKPKRGAESLLASSAVAAIRKEFGQATAKVATAAPAMRHLTTGIGPLDRALGGGLTTGQFHTLYGPESGSKTTTLLRTLGNAQLTCRNCYDFTVLDPGNCTCGDFDPHVVAYIRLEEFFTEWAKRFVNLDELVLFEPTFAEEALDILDGLVRSGECDVIALDSVAFLSPKKEVEDSVAKDNPAIQARQIGKGVRKTLAGLQQVYLDTNHRPTVLLTNQIRFKVGLVFGNPETKSGGQALVFAAATETRFRSVKVHIDKELGIPLYGDYEFKVNKNKTGAPKMEGVYRMYLSSTNGKRVGEIYDEMWIVSMAQKVGLLEGSGPSKTAAPFTIMGEKYKSKTALEERLVDDREYYFHVRKTLMTVLLALNDPEENLETSSQPDEDRGLELVHDE